MPPHHPDADGGASVVIPGAWVGTGYGLPGGPSTGVRALFLVGGSSWSPISGLGGLRPAPGPGWRPIHLAMARVCCQSPNRGLPGVWEVWPRSVSAVRRGVPVANPLPITGECRPPRTQRRWLAYLSDAGARPLHWPVQLPWDGRWAWDWVRLRKHTAWMTSEADAGLWSPCVQPPLDWGVAHAVVRYEARNPRAVRVDCGQTRNVFLVPYPEATP